MQTEDREKDLVQLATLIQEHNQTLARIAAHIGRPANVGHVGEYIAGAIFDIDLHESATTKGHDGYFNTKSSLYGRSVNVKWATAHDGLLNLSPDIDTDDYLVLAGPQVGAVSSKGKSRLWAIESVFLFDAVEIVGALTAAGVKVSIGTSIRKPYWDAAMIYPEARNPRLVLSDEQRRLLALFGQPAT